MPTASIVKGRGYLNHNDRTIKQVNSRSWKAELSSQNIVYVNEPIQNVYHELFLLLLYYWLQREHWEHYIMRLLLTIYLTKTLYQDVAL